MFCPNCGYENNNENKFCMECGKDIRQETNEFSSNSLENKNTSQNKQNIGANNYNMVNQSYSHMPTAPSINSCSYTKGSKTIRLVIGIISIVLSLVIVFQSCAAGVANAFVSPDSMDGTAGFFLSVFMLTSGIISIAARKTRGSIITAASFYLFGAVIGIANVGIFKDLLVWSVIAIIFAILLTVSLTMKVDNINSNKFSLDVIVLGIATIITIIISAIL